MSTLLVSTEQLEAVILQVPVAFIILDVPAIFGSSSRTSGAGWWSSAVSMGRTPDIRR
jgi:hypothetical protein